MLVIRLGDALAPVSERVEAEYRSRRDVSFDFELRAAFTDAPAEGVGNLTNPVEVLRKRLQQQLQEQLTELLKMAPTSTGDFVLDVFVLLNLGEPLVANACIVLIDMVLEIVDHQLQPMFPDYRTGAARRFRIVPVALLPASVDCETSRDQAVAELRKLHDTFRERIEKSRRDFAVDRFFLLDAITSRGIAALDDLVAEVGSFLRLVIFSGLRRTQPFVGLFENDCNDLFASFGIACCEVDYVAVQTTLARRLARRTASVLAEPGAAILPPVTDLLPTRALTDPDVLEQTVGELDDFPVRVLEAEGSNAVFGLRDLYDELTERLDTWAAEPPTLGRSQTLTTTRSGRRKVTSAVGGIVSGLGLGGIMFSVGYWYLLLSLTLSAVLGSVFAGMALVIVSMLLKDDDAPPDEAKAKSGESDEPDQEMQVALDVLTSTVSKRRGQLDSLATTFETIGTAIAVTDDAPAEAAPTGGFCDQLVGDELLEFLYERRTNDDQARDLADRWLATLGEWKKLLEGGVQPDAAALDDFCFEHFSELGDQPLFGDADVRRLAMPTITRFVEKWRNGLGVFLEGESRKQFDPDGFFDAFSSALVGPEEVGPDLRAHVREIEASLHPFDLASHLDDVFVFTAVADVHVDAVVPLAISNAESQ